MNNGGTWGFNHPAMLICRHNIHNYIVLHRITLHHRYIALHDIALSTTPHCVYIHIYYMRHCTTLHYTITLHHYIHYTITLHDILHITLHFIILHYIPQQHIIRIH